MTKPPSAPANPDALRAIEEGQLAAVGYLLIRCGQLWNQMAIARANAANGHVKLRQAHTRLFPYLTSRDGIRITDLAKRLDVSKQAIQPLVAELEEAGVVVVRVDPADGRALRVHLTGLGAAAFASGTSILKGIETELADALGDRCLNRLRTDLTTLLRLLDDRVTAAPAGAHPPDGSAVEATDTRHRRRR